jgi:hypothetical protein
MPQRLPIKAARNIGKEYDCKQVIVIAWDGELTHIVTWGKTIYDCDQAARGGNKLKEKWGWPECNDQPIASEATPETDCGTPETDCGTGIGAQIGRIPDTVTETRREGTWVYFDFKCPGCDAEGKLGLDTTEGMKPFACPEHCGSTFVLWMPADKYELKCVVQRCTA